MVRIVKLVRPRKARDLALVVAVLALGGVALGDAVRHATRNGGPATASARSGKRKAPTFTLPGYPAPGRIVFTHPGACELRVFDIRAGRFADVPRRPTSCSLSAPRVGKLVAYGVPGEGGGASWHFSLRDLEHPRTSFREYETITPIAWSPDGSKLAWCDTPRSGFELLRGRRAKRLHHCPRGYEPSGVTAFANERQQIPVDGRPLLKARGFVAGLVWGVDGSLGVVVGGRRLHRKLGGRMVDFVGPPRIDRYEDGRLAGAASLPSSPAQPFSIGGGLAPDNCAALAVGERVVRVVDLGCFRGQAPRTFRGVWAAWSPNGEWIAVAEPDAVVFHRVVGPEATVRWNVVVGQFAWVGNR